MPKKSYDDLPEVIVSSTEITRQVYQYVKLGKLRKLGPRVYTKNLKDPPEVIVKRNLWQIVGGLFPNAIIADRTALENQPAPDGSVCIISSKKRNISIHGIVIRPRKGHALLQNDMPFISGLFISSQPRAFLENMKPSRASKNLLARTLSQVEIEELLEKIYVRRGIKALNDLRDQAKLMSAELGLAKEYKKLDNLIGAFLGTRSCGLKSTVGIARQSGWPYDPKRADLFQTLFATLRNSSPVFRVSANRTMQELMHIAFFEAYFSNYIEGTEFEIDEAYNIIFKGRIPRERPEDAHDILGTYKIVSDYAEMQKTPKNIDNFVELLKKRHALIMEGRPDKNPGEFKLTINRAGGTVFVAPDLVLGTLAKGYEFYRTLDSALHKAIFIMFLVAEVHPFIDGNGRLARVMMNAELIAAGECRIIIPTIYRNNYLSALRALSLNGYAEPLLKTLEFAQKYTSRIAFSDFEGAFELLEQTNAFMDSNLADELGKRLVLPQM
ncbi:MAG: Fic family protein [Pseudomonadota bacterium]